jgi:hypothetical protein
MHITNYFITNVSRFEISQMHKHGIAMKKKVKIKCMKFELEHWFATFMPWITIYMHTKIPMMEVILKWHVCKLVSSLVIKKFIQTQFEILVCPKSTCTWKINIWEVTNFNNVFKVKC